RPHDHHRPAGQVGDEGDLQPDPGAGHAVPGGGRRDAPPDRGDGGHRAQGPGAGHHAPAEAGVQPPGPVPRRRLGAGRPVGEAGAHRRPPRRGPRRRRAGTGVHAVLRDGHVPARPPAAPAGLPGGVPPRRRPPPPARPDGGRVPGRRRRGADHGAVPQGRWHRSEPDGGQPRRPLRPVVEPGGGEPGHRPRLPHRPAPQRPGPQAGLRRHPGGPDRPDDRRQAGTGRPHRRRRRGVADRAVHRPAGRRVPPVGRHRGGRVSPPRRSRKPASAGRKPALGRQDLESLLAQIDALQSSRRTGSAGGGGTGGGRRAKADEVEIGRLRRLLADAIANDLNDDVSDEDEDDDWDEEPWDQDDPYDDEDEEGDWWPGGRWERFAPAKPIRVEGGLTTRSRRGAIGETWWSQRFLAAVEATTPGGRSTRGRSYARQGQVLELAVGAGLIEASVQGSRQTPYRVRLAMPVADDGEWDRLTVALAGQAGYAAQMLAGELPHEVEDVFAAEGVSLFPSRSSKLSTDCTCPDWANPCKHVAAVCYLVAEEFDRDPF